MKQVKPLRQKCVLFLTPVCFLLLFPTFTLYLLSSKRSYETCNQGISG